MATSAPHRCCRQRPIRIWMCGRPRGRSPRRSGRRISSVNRKKAKAIERRGCQNHRDELRDIPLDILTSRILPFLTTKDVLRFGITSRENYVDSERNVVWKPRIDDVSIPRNAGWHCKLVKVDRQTETRRTAQRRRLLEASILLSAARGSTIQLYCTDRFHSVKYGRRTLPLPCLVVRSCSCACTRSV